MLCLSATGNSYRNFEHTPVPEQALQAVCHSSGHGIKKAKILEKKQTPSLWLKLKTKVVCNSAGFGLALLYFFWYSTWLAACLPHSHVSGCRKPGQQRCHWYATHQLCRTIEFNHTQGTKYTRAAWAVPEQKRTREGRNRYRAVAPTPRTLYKHSAVSYWKGQA